MTSVDVSGALARPGALGGYEDWPAYMARHHHRAESAARQEVADALGVPAVSTDLASPLAPGHLATPGQPQPPGPTPTPGYTVHWEKKHDGVITPFLSWQLGFGPRTSAWFVRRHVARPTRLRSPGTRRLHVGQPPVPVGSATVADRRRHERPGGAVAAGRRRTFRARTLRRSSGGACSPETTDPRLCGDVHDDHLRLAAAGQYTGSFWQEPHVFTPAMQEEAAAFLASALQARDPINPPVPDRTRTDS